MRLIDRLVPEGALARALVGAVLLNAFAAGMTLPLSVLFLTDVVDLSPGLVGLGLTVAGIAGMVVGIPMGWLTDRLPAKQLIQGLLVALALTHLLFATMSTATQFAVLVVVRAVLDRGVSTVARVLVARTITDRAERSAVLARIRVALNIGISVGAGAAFVPLFFDSDLALRLGMLVPAITFAASALCYRALPYVPPQSSDHAEESASRRGRLTMLHVRYFALALAFGVLAFQDAMLVIGLPLWLTRHDIAPLWTVSALVLLNSVGVVLLQTRFAALSSSFAGARRSALYSGFLLLPACALFAITRSVPPVVAIGLLVLAGMIHLVGEILASNAQFNLSYDMAEDRQLGLYQGLFGTGMSFTSAFAPVLITSVVVPADEWGWLLLGGLFVAASASVVALTQRSVSEPLAA